MSEPTDEYERKYMDGGAAVARTRLRMPGWFFGLIAVTLAIQVTAALAVVLVAGAPFAAALPSLASIPLLAVVTLLFSHLRLTVTASHVIVQYGLFGPKIPLERIVAARVGHYDWKRYGGWGLKRARDGTAAFSVPGAGAACVELEYTDERGRTRRAVVSSDDPAAIVSAIERAREGRSGSHGVRVAAVAQPADATAEVATAEHAPDAARDQAD